MDIIEEGYSVKKTTEIKCDKIIVTTQKCYGTYGFPPKKKVVNFVSSTFPKKYW